MLLRADARVSAQYPAGCAPATPLMCKGVSIIAFSPSGSATTTGMCDDRAVLGMFHTKDLARARVNLEWHKRDGPKETANLF